MYDYSYVLGLLRASAAELQRRALSGRQVEGDDLDQFLATRFGKRMVEPIKAIHLVEEGRPIETMFDVTVAATAHARSIPNTDKRLEIEREAGQLLQAA
jgi:hypothetical protein